MKVFIIKNKVNSLFWNNSYGWQNREEATRFSKKETEAFFLPIDGEWVEEEINETYLVSYNIEVDAKNHTEAALQVEKILKDMKYRPSFVVIGSDEKEVDIDLEEILDE